MLVTQQQVLWRFWYATMPISQLQDGPRPFALLNEKIVLFSTPRAGPPHSRIAAAMQLCQWLYRNDTEADCSTAEIIAWDGVIIDEDRAILEATEYDVCIDTRHHVECHMTSDQPGLLMRQMLLELFHTHGEIEVHR